MHYGIDLSKSSVVEQDFAFIGLYSTCISLQPFKHRASCVCLSTYSPILPIHRETNFTEGVFLLMLLLEKKKRDMTKLLFQLLNERKSYPAHSCCFGMVPKAFLEDVAGTLVCPTQF